MNKTIYPVSASTLESRQTALESSASISTIPILMGRTAPCGRIIILLYRSWQNNFSKDCSQINIWLARFLIKRSWRIKSNGSLYSKRACLLYSVFKEQSACQPMKIYCFQQTFIGWQTLVNRDRKEGIFKSCPYYFFISYLISISKFFTICMIASRIRPFSSISTAI